MMADNFWEKSPNFSFPRLINKKLLAKEYRGDHIVPPLSPARIGLRET